MLNPNLNLKREMTHQEQFDLIYNTCDWGDEQPQADLFVKLLNTINTSKPSMIELGSGGTDASIYSILFEKKFNYNCTIINTEPRQHLLDQVRTLWKDIHLVNAKLYHGYTGELEQLNQYLSLLGMNGNDIPQLRVNNLLKENNLTHLDLLHADIQGSEVSLCKELECDGILKNIRYYFISTHSKECYDTCKNILERNIRYNYHFSDEHKGGYGDGLIVVENLDYLK